VSKADSSKTDSIVNVAYGTVHRNDLSSAISVLNPTEYLDKNHGTYPGDGIAAFVGGSNFWNVGDALVLVDGVPRPLNEVTTTEIQQITFLKGVNAVVLYGSRAAGGVLLVTTKHGKAGVHRSNIFVNTGIEIPKSYPDYLKSAEYMKYYNQACVNDGIAPLYSDETINNYASHSNVYRYPDVDYYSSEYLRSMSNYNRADADFSGGNDRAQFYAQSGFQHSNSLVNFGEGKNENITRFNIRGNIDLKLNDFIKTYINMSNVFYDARFANGDFWSKSAQIQPHRYSPLVPIDMIAKDSLNAQLLAGESRHVIDGKYILGGTQEYLTNPIADVYAAGYNTFTRRQFQYNAGAIIDLNSVLSGLTFATQIAVDYSNQYNEVVSNTYAVYLPTWDDSVASDNTIYGLTKYNKDKNAGETKTLTGNWNSQVLDFNMHFDYLKTFNEVHNFSAKLIAAAYRGRQTGDYQYRTNSNLGLQLAYNFDQTYYVDFSGAVVNSIKLSPKKRVAFSPTASVGWVLSNEEFLKGSDVVNRLKVSVSGGILNTDVDLSSYYLYNTSYISDGWYSWSDDSWRSQATVVTRGTNENLTYAKRKEITFGLEGELFNKLINFQTNVFYIKKDGIPVQNSSQYPSYFVTGWPKTSFLPYNNFAANSYKGFDFQISFNKKLGDVNLTVGASGTYTVSKAEVRDELYQDKYRNRAGKPINAIFGLQSEGLFSDDKDIESHARQKFGIVKPGDIKYKDQNGDNIIDENDEVMIGEWGSPFYCGLHITTQYKAFTLFVLGTGGFGGTSMKSGSYYWVYGNGKYSSVVRDSWTEATKNTAAYPRLTTLSGDNNFRNSDFWTYSADYFNLSKIQLTYTVPERFFKNSYLKGLNLFVSGFDLLTISENKDIMELNVGSSPQTRFYNLGVKAVF
jgi:TonB-linked SusC/RagA family outer membrane protein